MKNLLQEHLLGQQNAFLRRRLVTLLFSFLASLGCGTLYVYSAYATELAERLDLSAVDSSLIGMASPVGTAFFGGIGGMLADTYGPLWPCLGGSVLQFGGYYTVYRCYMNQYSNVPLIVLSLLLSGFGSTCVYSAAMKTAATNFPDNRGSATAVPMSAFGLSAFFFSSLGSQLFPGDTGAFLLMLAVTSSALTLISTRFIQILVDPHVDAADGEVLLADETNEQEDSAHGHLAHPGYAALDDPEHVQHHHHHVKIVGGELHQPGEVVSRPVGGLRLFQQKLYYIHFILQALLCSSGQMFIYCVGYIVTALEARNHGGPPPPAVIQSMQEFQVAISSSMNCVGRLLAGPLTDWIVHRHGAQRAWLLFLCLGFAVVGNVLALHVTDVQDLWILSLTLGLSYGLLFGVYPSMISHMWGLDNFSGNWGIMSICQVTSSYIISFMFGVIYDSNSEHMADSHASICLKGAACYTHAFQINIWLNGVTVIVLLAVLYYNHKYLVVKP